MLTFDPAIHQDERDAGLPGSESDTARLWVSDQQWLKILERVERGIDAGLGSASTSEKDYSGGGGEATGKRDEARHEVNFRCVIRLAPPANPQADHGTYLVHSRNISSGGLGFVHGHELQAGTRCTVALQPAEGKGMVLSARVAWCRAIQRVAEDTLTYDVGVQFDRPIDISPFVPAA